MRVDAYNQVNQLYQATKTKKISSTGEVSAKDQVQISQTGKDYQVAKNAVAGTSEVREDKVESLRSAVASGTYNVSSQEIAENIVSKYFDSSS